MNNKFPTIFWLAHQTSKQIVLKVTFITLITVFCVYVFSIWFHFHKRSTGIVLAGKPYLNQLINNNDMFEITRYLNSFISTKTFFGYWLVDKMAKKIVIGNSENDIEVARIDNWWLEWQNGTLLYLLSFDLNSHDNSIQHTLIVASALPILPLLVLLSLVLLIMLFLSAYISSQSSKLAQQITKPILSFGQYLQNATDFNDEKEINVLDFEYIEIMEVYNHFKTLYDRLINSEKKTEQFSRLAAIGHTTAILAHDVRKPFSKLEAMLDYFDDYKNSPKELQKAKQEIKKSIKQADSMINDIMDFSREVTLETKPESIIDMMDFSIREIAQSNQEVDIQFVYNLQHTHKLLADNARLVRVFSNIIGNGIEAIRDIGKRNTGTIEIHTQEIEKDGKQFVEIILGNDGPLIRDEDLPNLFESFFTKGKKKGTGLGLASAQKIITLHGGEIKAGNRENEKGVEFVMTIPASNESEEIRIENLPKNSKEAAFVELKKDSNEIDQIIEQLKNNKFKILLLEDEALYRAAVKSTIKKNEILNNIVTIYDAHTIDEALEIVEHEHITHAIVDIDLGDIKDGFDFLAAVGVGLVPTQRGQPQGLPLQCMIHSNRHLEEFRQKAFLLGAKAFVPKPLALEHLVDFLVGEEKVSGCRLAVSVGEEYKSENQKMKNESPATSNQQQATKVLVIDDDSIIRKVTADIVSKYFKQKRIDEATSPEGALELVKNNSYEYIFCDINFDNSTMNGYELVSEMRKVHATTKIYLVSSTPTDLAMEGVRSCGADGYIEQPITKEKIQEGLGFRGQDLERKENRGDHFLPIPNPQILNPNLVLGRVFHDIKKQNHIVSNFLTEFKKREYLSPDEKAHWEELIQVYSSYAERVMKAFREYLKKQDLQGTDELMLVLINEARAFQDAEKRTYTKLKEHGGSYEETESTYC